MGDQADAYTDEQEDLYFDHQAGHVAFPCDYCPYCDEEEAKEKAKLKRKKDTLKNKR